MEKRNDRKSAPPQSDDKDQPEAKSPKDDDQTPVIQDLASI